MTAPTLNDLFVSFVTELREDMSDLLAQRLTLAAVWALCRTELRRSRACAVGPGCGQMVEG